MLIEETCLKPSKIFDAKQVESATQLGARGSKEQRSAAHEKRLSSETFHVSSHRSYKKDN